MREVQLRISALLFTGILFTSCGGEDGEPAVDLTYRTVAGAPSTGTLADERTLEVSGRIERLGHTDARDLVAVVDGRVHQAMGDAFELRRRYANSDEPTTYGAVRDIEPRHEDGAYLATEEGLFLLGDLFVTRSPLSDEVGALHAVSEATSGPLAGLWLAGDQGLFVRGDAGLETLTVDGALSTPRRLAVEPGGRFAAVVYGVDELFVIQSVSGALEAAEPELPTGPIHEVAAGPGILWVAADGGLFAYDPQLRPAWTQYALADAEPLSVLALAVDRATQSAWARTSNALVRVSMSSPGTVTAFAQPRVEPGDEPTLGFDRLGQLWSSHDGVNLQTARITDGETELVAFARDVAPWIDEHCAQCHSNQTADFSDYEVFRARAFDALSRVTSGDMPRCDGGLRCPPEDNLTPDDYAVLDQWIRDGLQP